MDKGSRFSFVNDVEIDPNVSEKTPQNTVKSTQWAVNLWNAWATERNKQQKSLNFPNIPPMELITSTITETQFVFFLKRLIFEVRNKNGQPYTPDSLKLFCCGIQRYLKENGWPMLAVMDTSKREYKEFHDALDTRSKELYAEGIGTTRKQIDLVTDEHESILWDKGIFNTNSSKGLSYTVFFYTSKAFGLRTGDDQRSLKSSQFSFGSDEHGKYVQLSARSKKVFKAGMKRPDHFRSDTCKHYQDKNNPRCYYNILEKYISLIPKGSDNFYFRPGYKLHYCPHVIGKNALDSYVATMMKEAEIDGYFTNRSVRGTLVCHTLKPIEEQQLQTPTMSVLGGRESQLNETELTTLKRNESPLQPQEVTTSKESELDEQEVTTLKRQESPLQVQEVTTLKRKDDPSQTDEVTVSNKRKKYEDANHTEECHSEESATDFDTKIKIEPTDSEDMHYGDFALNLGNFLSDECIIKPSDVFVKKETHGDGGQLTIQIKYTLKN